MQLPAVPQNQETKNSRFPFFVTSVFRGRSPAGLDPVKRDLKTGRGVLLRENAGLRRTVLLSIVSHKDIIRSFAY